MSEKRLAAIMFTDIVGFTMLMGKDEEKTLELLRRNREIHKTLIKKHKGKWLKEMGDGILVQFNSAFDSVQCAIDLQEAATRELDGQIRIGIHLGDITLENNDVFGDGVNIANRLQAAADPGGIFISGSIQVAIRGISHINTHYLGIIAYKNVDYPIKTYALLGENLPLPVTKSSATKKGKIMAELIRRGVLEVAIFYVLAAILIIQSATVAFPSFNVPDWGISLVIILMLIGFPIALFIGWSFEMGPKGLSRTTKIDNVENPQISVKSNLFASRPAMVIFILLLGSQFVLKILDFSLVRLNISPNWTELLLYSLLLTLPTLFVLLLIPRKSTRRSMRIIRRVMPISNFAITVIVLVIVFWGKELGAMTSEVSYQDEFGVTHTQSVLKGEFIKKVYLAPFIAEPSVAEADLWMVTGIPIGLNKNLDQFRGLVGRYLVVNNKSLNDQIYMTTLNNFDYLVRGTYYASEDSLSIQLELYNKTGKLLMEDNVGGINFFQLLDNVKMRLLTFLDIHSLKSEPINLPFDEFVTNNLGAFKAYVNGDYSRAFAADPGFAYAYLSLASQAFEYSWGDRIKQEITKKGMSHIHKLPEKDQLKFRAFYLLANGKKDDALKAYQKSFALNPIISSIDFISFLTVNQYYDEAIAVGLAMIKKKFSGDEVLQVGKLMLYNGQTEEARDLLEYSRFLIPDFAVNVGEGWINLAEGEYAAAIDNFETAYLDKPQYYTLDSLIKVSAYMMQAGDNKLDAFALAINGTYISEINNTTISVNYRNGQFGLVNSGQMPYVNYPINDSSIYYCMPFNDIQYETIKTFIKGETGNVLKMVTMDKATPRNSFWTYPTTISQFESETHAINNGSRIYFKVMPQLMEALGNFTNAHYKEADSLFRIVYSLDSGYYFINGYLDAIDNMRDTTGMQLIPSGLHRFRNNERDEDFEISQNGDHYLQKFGRTMKLYPAHDNWLMNSDAKRVRWQVNKIAGRLTMELFIFDHSLDKFVTAGTYTEVPEE